MRHATMTRRAGGSQYMLLASNLTTIVRFFEGAHPYVTTGPEERVVGPDIQVDLVARGARRLAAALASAARRSGKSARYFMRSGLIARTPAPGTCSTAGYLPSARGTASTP